MLARTLLTSFLAATASASFGAPAELTKPFRAQGSDPSWSLTIADGRMIYESPGQPSVSVATPSARNDYGITVYRTPALSVRIIPVGCADEVSGRLYADSVFVTVGRQEREGCGGAELPADSLNGTSWRFVEIAGEPVELIGDLPKNDSYMIYFGVYLFAGVGGCTRFSADYSRDGDTLTAEPLTALATRNCPEPIMSREHSLLRILGAPVRVSFPDPKTMVLNGETGTIKLSRTKMEDEP